MKEIYQTYRTDVTFTYFTLRQRDIIFYVWKSCNSFNSGIRISVNEDFSRAREVNKEQR